MKVDEMPAGPELDKLIAKKVMGWEKIESDGVFYWSDPTIDELHNGRVADERNMFGTPLEDLRPWSPSTNIADAWEIVEKLTMRCGYSIGRSDPFAMLEHEVLGHEELDTLVVYADTVPLAICHAALKATSAVTLWMLRKQQVYYGPEEKGAR